MLSSGIQVRRAEERGTTKTDWLLSRHSFSFGDYRDASRMGFGPVRVLNDDIVQSHSGFGTHPHRDMDIVTFVLDGAVQHKDSEGNEHVIRAGEAQFMRAGTGIEHSEMNPFEQPVHFLQMWFVPRTRGLPPAYDQRLVEFPARGGFTPIASPGLGGFDIDADAMLLAARIAKGGRVGHVVHGGRQCYVFVANGSVALGSDVLAAGDAAIVKDGVVGLRGEADALVLVFDVPAG